MIQIGLLNCKLRDIISLSLIFIGYLQLHLSYFHFNIIISIILLVFYARSFIMELAWYLLLLRVRVVSTSMYLY